MTFDPAKPVQTRNGRAARIICTDRKGDIRNIVALVASYDTTSTEEFVLFYYSDGSCSLKENSDTDLINIKTKKWKWAVKIPQSMPYCGLEIVTANHLTEKEIKECYTTRTIVGRILETEIEE